MINEKMFSLGNQPNKIREIYAYGLERKAVVGEENVFDLSIGNPSVPSPREVDDTIALMATESDGTIHGYTPSPGLASVREVIAQNLNKRFGEDFSAGNLYLTSGASSSIAIALKGLVLPGEEVITVAPYFPEYRTWTEACGATLVPVHAREEDFQIDIEGMAAAVTEKTAAVIINSPNNPVGSVYSDQNLTELAQLLKQKSDEIGHPIYLVSDEPYRELVYDGVVPAWVPKLYDATIVCYSWSKSFSLPGERIGYILVPSRMPEFERVYKAVCGGGRELGYICAGTMFQNLVARCIDAPVDVEPYDINRRAFVAGLEKLGYEFIMPQGAFYMWIKALEPDAGAFCQRAKEYELLLVPSDTFGVTGWVRAGYCCTLDVIERSMDAFEKLRDSYAG